MWVGSCTTWPGASIRRCWAVAWAYVRLRALHSAIHLTYNNVVHRLTAFALSNVVLAVFWLMFFLR
jgi:hypothetical protein